MDVDWEPEAARLAAEVTAPVSRWRGPVSVTPRHLFVPRWWRHLDPDGWTLRDGPADEQRWMKAAYSDRSLVTRVGAVHADHAAPADHPAGRPTSSSTMPGLVVRMYQHPARRRRRRPGRGHRVGLRVRAAGPQARRTARDQHRPRPPT